MKSSKRIILATALFIGFSLLPLAMAHAKTCGWWERRCSEDSPVTWSKRISGDKIDGHSNSGGQTVAIAGDKGYLFGGFTYCTASAQNSGICGSLVRLDASGKLLWEQRLGGTVNMIRPTRDGGFVLVGDIPAPGGIWGNFTVVKIREDGSEEWRRSFGNNQDNHHGYAVQQTTDGGYVAVGQIWTGANMTGDATIIKLTPSGDEQWRFSHGGMDSYEVRAVRQAPDGGYVMVGQVMVNSADKDVWIAKLNASGQEEWLRSFGSSPSTEGLEDGMSIELAAEGGYLVLGSKPLSTYLGNAISLLKVNEQGQEEWSRQYGNKLRARSIAATADGGYVIVGNGRNFLDTQALIMKVDGQGNEQWSRLHGSAFLSDFALDIQQTLDGGYILSGGATSLIGSEMYVLKLDANGNL